MSTKNFILGLLAIGLTGVDCRTYYVGGNADGWNPWKAGGYAKMEVDVSDSVVFDWSSTATDLHRFKTKTAWEGCDTSDTIALVAMSDTGTYTFESASAGSFYFASSNGCGQGQKVEIEMTNLPPAVVDCLTTVQEVCNYEEYWLDAGSWLDGGRSFFCAEDCHRETFLCKEQLHAPFFRNTWLACEIEGQQAKEAAGAPKSDCFHYLVETCGLDYLVGTPPTFPDESQMCSAECTALVADCPEFSSVATVIADQCSMAASYGCDPAKLVSCGFASLGNMLMDPEKMCAEGCRDAILGCDGVGYTNAQNLANTKASGNLQLDQAATWMQGTMDSIMMPAFSGIDYGGWYDQSCEVLACNASKCMLYEVLDESLHQGFEDPFAAWRNTIPDPENPITADDWAAQTQVQWTETQKLTAALFNMMTNPNAQVQAQENAQKLFDATLLKMCLEPCQTELQEAGCQPLAFQVNTQFMFLGNTMEKYCETLIARHIEDGSASGEAKFQDLLDTMHAIESTPPAPPNENNWWTTNWWAPRNADGTPAPPFTWPSMTDEDGNLVNPWAAWGWPVGTGDGDDNPMANWATAWGTTNEDGTVTNPMADWWAWSAEQMQTMTGAEGQPNWWQWPAPATGASPTAMQVTDSLAEKLMDAMLDHSAPPLSEQQMQYLADKMGMAVEDLPIAVKPDDEGRDDSDQRFWLASIKAELKNSEAPGNFPHQVLAGMLAMVVFALYH